MNEENMNLLLFDGVAACFFTDKHPLGPGWCFVKQGEIDQAIIDHDISHTKAAETLKGDQLRVTGASTDQVDFAGCRWLMLHS